MKRARSSASAKPGDKKSASNRNFGNAKSFFSSTKPSDRYVECFVCGTRVLNDNDLFHLHLNACLERLSNSFVKDVSSADGFDSASVAISSTSSETIKDSGHQSCFICGIQLMDDNDFINLHLDACLGKTAKMAKRDDDIRTGENRPTPINIQIPNTTAPTCLPQAASSQAEDSSKMSPVSSTFSGNQPRLYRSEIALLFPRPFTLASQSQSEIATVSFDHCVLTIVPGLIIIRDFISVEEEAELLTQIDLDGATPWQRSLRSGVCDTKAFGVRTQFGVPRSNVAANSQSVVRGIPSKYSSEVRGIRRNDEYAGEMDLPPYSDFIVKRFESMKMALIGALSERIKTEAIFSHKPSDPTSSKLSIASLKRLKDSLQAFVPNECNMNSYTKSQGHYLKPHVDDRQLSGPILMNLSLCGQSLMRYTSRSNHVVTAAGDSMPLIRDCQTRSSDGLPFDTGFGRLEDGSVWVDVPLERRCLQLIAGEGRYKWEHEIRPEDIRDPRRVSITWRGAGITGASKASLML